MAITILLIIVHFIFTTAIIVGPVMYLARAAQAGRTSLGWVMVAFSLQTVVLLGLWLFLSLLAEWTGLTFEALAPYLKSYDPKDFVAQIAQIFDASPEAITDYAEMILQYVVVHSALGVCILFAITLVRAGIFQFVLHTSYAEAFMISVTSEFISAFLFTLYFSLLAFI